MSTTRPAMASFVHRLLPRGPDDQSPVAIRLSGPQARCAEGTPLFGACSGGCVDFKAAHKQVKVRQEDQGCSFSTLRKNSTTTAGHATSEAACLPIGDKGGSLSSRPMSKAEAHLFYGIRASVRVTLMQGRDNSNLTPRLDAFYSIQASSVYRRLRSQPSCLPIGTLFNFRHTHSNGMTLSQLQKRVRKRHMHVVIRHWQQIQI